MAYSITIDHPDFPDGYEFYINGLPMMKNREEFKLSQEDERQYALTNRMLLGDYVAKLPTFKVKGTPTVTDSIEKLIGVDPTTISDTPSADPTVENRKVAEEFGLPWELITVDGIVTEPNVVNAEVSPAADTTLPATPKGLTPATDAAADAALEQGKGGES